MKLYKMIRSKALNFILGHDCGEESIFQNELAGGSQTKFEKIIVEYAVCSTTSVGFCSAELA